MSSYSVFILSAYLVVLVVLGGLTIASLQCPQQGAPRAGRARSRERQADDSQAQAAVAAGGLARRAGRRGGAGADGAERQPRLLLFAEPDRREEHPAGTPLPPGRPGRGRQREEERPGGALHRHRHAQDDRASSIAACCPISSARARVSSPRARSAPTACSSPARSWPSTTRTTCRPRSPRRSRKRAVEGAQMMRSIICAGGRQRLERHAEPARGAQRCEVSAVGSRLFASLRAGAVRREAPMIPELGHFALILALAVALVQGTLPLVGAARGDARLMALGSTAALTQALLVDRCLRRPHPGLRHVGLLRRQRRRQLAFGQAAGLQDHRRVGEPRGQHAPVGADPRRVRRRRGAVRRQPARHAARARARHPGADRRGLPRLPAVHLQSLRAPVAGARRRQRPQSAAAGSGPGLPSAAALSRLCRLLGDLRLRHRRPARRPRRSGLGALGAAVDARRLVLPDARHRARLVVGLLHPRLGRLLVLGSRSRTPR